MTLKRAVVRLNGVDVTNDCFYVDGRRGVVRVYLRDAAGKFFLTPERVVAKAERRGHVRIRMRAA